jgi:hypothetical protein
MKWTKQSAKSNSYYLPHRAVAGSLAFTTESFAQTTSATKVTNGSGHLSGPEPSEPVIVVPIHMARKQMMALAQIMHSDRNSCYLQDLQPQDDSSMIMICGVDQPVASFAP